MEIVAAADSCVPSCGLRFHVSWFSQARSKKVSAPAPKMRNSHIHKGSYM